MKVHYFAILLPLCTQVVAQQQPTYEKKTFRDELGNLYWNLSLPVYLQISFSAEMKDPQALTNVKTPEMKKYANPIYFDGHGSHFIRHMDYESPVAEREIAFAVNVDGFAPKTFLTLLDAPVFFNAKLFYGKNLRGTLSATDEMSGVETTQQSINGAAYSNYTGAMALAQEGDYSVKFYSVDRVGNVGIVQAKEFIVDLTAPQSGHAVSIDHLNGTILSPRSRLKLSSVDQLSGVKSIKFKVNDGKEATYINELAFVGLPDGEHTIKYAATDQVNNTEEAKQFNFYYDATPPEVTSSFNGDFIVNETKSFMGKSATFSLTAIDNKAGVKEIYYSLNGGEQKLYASEVSLPKQGAYTVKFKSIDAVNNQTIWKTNSELKNVFVDDTPPAISHSFNGPKYFTRDTVFITKETFVQLFAIDNESGVLNIEYQADTKAMQSYSAPFTQTDEGFHAVKFIGIDQVKNAKSETFIFIVDNSGPEIFYHMSLDKIGTQKLEQKSVEIPVYASSTSFYLAATDKLVGTKAIYYQIDTAPEVLYTTPVKLLQKGLHVIKIRAVDNLGNQTKQEFEFAVQ